jgi:hypothetical protein
MLENKKGLQMQALKDVARVTGLEPATSSVTGIHHHL